MFVYNSSNNLVLASEVYMAKNFITRSFGLIFNNDMSEDEALVITPCCSIHTFFMKFPIDVIFINKSGQVLAIHENVTPWKILPIYWKSKYVIELKAQNISDRASVGDEILIQ